MSAGPAVSLRRLARLIGVSEKAVRKAFAAGAFKAGVRRSDDGVPVVLDVSVAVAEWEASGRKLRGSARGRVQPSTTAAPDSAAAATEPGRYAGDCQGGLADLAGDPDDEPAAASADTPPPQSLLDAQIETMKERARKLRMENDLRKGTLVEVDRVKREAFEFARTLRENILNIPARLSAELAAEMDGARVYSRLEAALREALEATVSVLEAAPANEGVA